MMFKETDVNKFIGYAAMAAVISLTGACNKTATGQVVAVVNGEEVSQQELNAETSGLNLPANIDKKAVTAQALQRIIDRKLLVQKAKAEDFDKSPEYLVQSRRLQEDLLIKLLSNKAAKGVALPDRTAVNQYIQAHPTMFGGRKRLKLDQVAFPFPSDTTILKKLEPTHDFPSVIAVLTAANVKFQRGQATLDTATIAPEMAAKVQSLPPGEPFVTPVNGGYVVSVITGAEDIPTTEALATPAATELIRRQAIESALQADLKAAREKAKIEYQPGFEPGKPAAKQTAAK